MIDESIIILNVAMQSGGGVFVHSSSSVDVSSSFIALNRASGGGGGIAMKSPSSTLNMNTTVLLANTAIRSYGGALNILGGVVTLIDCQL